MSDGIVIISHSYSIAWNILYTSRVLAHNILISVFLHKSTAFRHICLGLTPTSEILPANIEIIEGIK